MNWDQLREILSVLTSGAVVALVRYFFSLNNRITVLEATTTDLKDMRHSLRQISEVSVKLDVLIDTLDKRLHLVENVLISRVQGRVTKDA